jgi:hypothetical protein
VRSLNAAANAKFQQDLNVFTKDLLPKDVLRFTRAIALHILRGVVIKTPVGNPSLWKGKAPKGYVGGHARMNWQVTLNFPSEGSKEGADPSGGYALLDGAAEIAQAGAYQKIWIVNNVPYIMVLENGRGPDERGIMRGSTQAPNGMLGVTMEEVRRDFNAR